VRLNGSKSSLGNRDPNYSARGMLLSRETVKVALCGSTRLICEAQEALICILEAEGQVAKFSVFQTLSWIHLAQQQRRVIIRYRCAVRISQRSGAGLNRGKEVGLKAVRDRYELAQLGLLWNIHRKEVCVGIVVANCNCEFPATLCSPANSDATI